MMRKAFTLVELLVVISIITILAAMLLPVLENAVLFGRVTACSNQQRQQFVALSLRLDDYSGTTPYIAQDATYVAGRLVANIGGGSPTDPYRSSYVAMGQVWAEGYLADAQALYCPGAQAEANPSYIGGYFSHIIIPPAQNNVTVIFNRANINKVVNDAPTPKATESACLGTYSTCLWNPTTQNDSPARQEKWDKRPDPMFPVFLCAQDAAHSITMTPNMIKSHQRRFTNCLYGDGHVRDLKTLAYLQYLDSVTNYTAGYGSTHTNCLSWWKWAKAAK